MTEPAPLPDLWEFLKDMQVVPFGIPIMQRSWQVLTIFSLIETLHIETFIELGVWAGGLADLLIRRAEVVKEVPGPTWPYMEFIKRQTEMVYYGFDLVDQIDSRLKHYLRPPSHWNQDYPRLTIGDVFDLPIMTTVSRRIRARPGAAFIYCDDGDKPREMRTYAPILRVGDYMMSHDVPSGNSVVDLAAFATEMPFMVEIDPPLYRGLELSLWRRNT